ncbi:MAG: ATP-binding protein [Candidatus Riflebacteria bacterium]|nr:ATP-binding protein [Candidatus Riflebacteria bacterium]
MFISFRVENFRSIVDTTISMTYDEGKAPNGYKSSSRLPFLEQSKYRLIPCLAIYGANASGKSNIIRAFSVFVRLLKFGIQGAFDPNRLCPQKETSAFEAQILLDQSVYLYRIEYSDKGIVLESLKKTDKTIFEIQKSNIVESRAIISETYGERQLKDFLRVECSNKDGIQNRTFLNLIGEKYAGLNKDMASVLEFFLSSVFITSDDDILELLDSSLCDKLQTIIAQLDFGIQRIEINQNKLLQRRNRQLHSLAYPLDDHFAEYLYSYHKDNQGKDIRFDFQEESDGTQIAFGILANILAALDRGGIVLIDELDRSLHSLVFQQVVALIKDRRYNLNNTQFIFTAHNTDILDSEILRVSEVGFVNKTTKKGTTLQRLVEFDKVRNVANFRKRYLSGEFAGIPFPYL